MFSRFCDQTQNRFIFPAISSIFICLFYYTDRWHYRLIFAGFFLFFLRKENKQIIGLSLICSTLVLFSCWLKETKPIDDQRTFERIMVASDTVKMNGDLVTFIGHTTDKQKISCSYYAKSEQERNSFLVLRHEAIELIVVGDYQETSKQRNPYGFDQKKYDQIHRIKGRFQIRQIKEHLNRNAWQNMLSRTRGRSITFIQEHFSHKVSVYMNALIFGYKDSQFLASEDTYKETGLLHLFSLSGMHIQTYLGWLYYLFRRGGMTLTASYLPLVGGTLGYFSLSGGSVSVKRAGLSFLLKLGLKLLNVKFSSFDHYSIILWILLLIEPLCLFQVEGQLSLGMSFFFLLLSHPTTKFQKFTTIVLFSIGIMPLTAWHFYEWPLLGSMLTLLFAPVFKKVFLPCLTFLFVFGRVLPPSVSELLNSFLVHFESLLDSLRFANLVIGRPNGWLLIFSLGFLLWLIEKKQHKPCQCVTAALLVPIILIFGRFLQFGSSITFNDVGQGDSILFKAPFLKEIVMIDTGGKLGFQKEAWQERRVRPPAEFNLVPFLKGNGIRRINKLILTHDDIDHVGEITTLAKHFKIDTIYIGWGAGRSAWLYAQLQKLEKAGTTICEVRQGDWIKGYFDFFVLSPITQGKGENEDSIGLSVTHQSCRFLFLGDFDQLAEEKIGNAYPDLKADVIKLGHHGSRTSSHPQFISQLEATYGVLSCGVNNLFGHPHEDVLATLKQNKVTPLRTDRQGAITFKWHPFWYPEGKIHTMID
ncbi:DNA internalization-related competence protein ComEC/Rec2 [Enterococcus hirae]|uniref:DNA internalization-related competence protein ComEC/Rec2 n=1 Tax=Enterococcus hirae TaxID=1354 RepID=UPI0009C02C6D|nr:DNA internalization-related competence protein ComEC/Rec2 [Enterococcus hirae]OQO55829.1 DNA internalization-related competence protein ComEC/Rec2 [Enterococcus hirae]